MCLDRSGNANPQKSIIGTMVSTILGVMALGAMQAPKAQIKVTINPKPVSAGVYAASAKVTFPEGWHGYTNPVKDEYDTPVSLKSLTKGATLESVKYPPANAEFTGKPVYEGEISITFQLKLAKAPTKKTEVEVGVNYQMCNDRSCLPPATVSTKVTIDPKGKQS